MILRLSQKLHTKMKGEKLVEMPLAENPYLDWSSHLFAVGRKQYILLSNTASLYSYLMAGKGITNHQRFIHGALNTMREFMTDDGQGMVYQQMIAPVHDKVCFAKSLNRKVIGSMNELVMAATFSLESGKVALTEVAHELNALLLSAIALEKRGYVRPKEAFIALAERYGRAHEGT